MSTLELRALAAEIRSRAGSDDAVTESVAAALESVSERRARRQPWRGVRNAAIALMHSVASRGLPMVGSLVWWPSSGRNGDGPMDRAGMAAAPARTATKRRVQTIDLSPSALEQAFRSVSNGCGLLPDLCDSLIRHGWAEWVDHTDFTPLDETHPRSVLIMTPAGEQQYAELRTKAAR